MGRKQGDSEDVKEWSESNETAFLNILYERVKKDPNGLPNFKVVDWQEMDEELFSASGERYGTEKLRGKYNRLRQRHRQFSELLEHTGVTYDSNSNVVNAVQDVWQMFYKKHKNFKAFRKHGCKNYELLGLVFGKSSPIGHLHHASTQLSPISDEDRHLNEEEFLDRGTHVVASEKSSSDGSKRKLPADDFPLNFIQVSKDSQLEKLNSYLEEWASSHIARIERKLVKVEKYKSQGNRAISGVSDPYSIEACMDVLESMDDISTNAYNKALEKIIDQDWRKIFILMSAKRRHAWLDSLV